MVKTFKPGYWGTTSSTARYVEWIVILGSLATGRAALRVVPHALYYTLAALLRVLGVGHDGIRGLSFVFAFARLLIPWERARALSDPGGGLRGSPPWHSRLVLPTAVHLDARLSNVPLLTLLPTRLAHLGEASAAPQVMVPRPAGRQRLALRTGRDGEDSGFDADRSRW